jgi:hypothetical protein
LAELPSFLVARPPMPQDAATLAAFDALFETALAAGPGAPIAYDLPQPRWQFICHITDTREVLVHGSSERSITEFEPRQPSDATEFGNQRAVYAASDGLWAMYFAILDRAGHPMSMNNSAVRIKGEDGPGDPYYFFSISRTALEARAFSPGTLYFLPRRTFVQQPVEQVGAHRVHVAHWASLEPVRPLARMTVEPSDFPLLAQIRGHDDETMFARARADPKGFPWLD